MHKILIVDDDAVITLFLEDRLSDMGYNVVGIARDGDEAYAMAATHLPDLILMDIVMRGALGGISAAIRIQEKSDTPIIFMTGHKDHYILEEVKKANPAAYITKPIDTAQLKASIEISLIKREAEREILKSKNELERRVKQRTADLENANLALIRSIQECREVEEALRSSEQKHRHLLDTMNDGFIVVDENASITYVNNKFTAMVGYDAPDIMGHTLVDFGGKGSKEVIDRQLALRKKGIKDSYEFQLIHKEGQMIDTIISPQPLFNKNGDFEGSFATITDVSNLKEAEKQLRKNETRLKELNAALKVLLQKRDENRHLMEKSILFSVKSLILPHLDKLKQAGLDHRLQEHVQLTESQLMNMVSPFMQKLATQYLNLIPTEIEVANYIREGKSSKEIASLINVAKCTVDIYRNRIRKKLNITGRTENLRSHLLSLGVKS